MARNHLIDPSLAKNTVNPAESLDPQIPPDVRAFGYIPDIGQLRPGDLLLFSSIKPSRIAKALSTKQRDSGFSDEDARWTHAAVHIAKGRMVEAVPVGGVRLGFLFDRILSSLVCVRRRAGLTKLQRAEICIEALSRLGQGYSLSYIWRMRKLLANRFHWDPIHNDDAPNICSMLYYYADLEVTNDTVVPGKYFGISPAHLSATKTLADVKVNWLRLP